MLLNNYNDNHDNYNNDDHDDSDDNDGDDGNENDIKIEEDGSLWAKMNPHCFKSFPKDKEGIKKFVSSGLRFIRQRSDFGMEEVRDLHDEEIEAMEPLTTYFNIKTASSYITNILTMMITQW